MSLRIPFRSSAARRGALALLCVLGPAAHAATTTPQLTVLDAATVADSNGNQTLRFSIDAAVDVAPSSCPPSNPGCNARSVRVCVDYATVPGTATPGVDFIPRSGRIDTVIPFEASGPELLPLGMVDVTVLGDALVEGTETVKLQLTAPPPEACPSGSRIQRGVAQGLITDGVYGAPDLVVQQAAVSGSCGMSFVLRNIGTGTVPDVAYASHSTPVSQVKVVINGIPTQATLSRVDPQRLLQTPGAAVAVPSWMDLITPFKLEGPVQMQVTVDANGVITESLESNNVLRGAGGC